VRPSGRGSGVVEAPSGMNAGSRGSLARARTASFVFAFAGRRGAGRGMASEGMSEIEHEKSERPRYLRPACRRNPRAVAFQHVRGACGRAGERAVDGSARGATAAVARRDWSVRMSKLISAEFHRPYKLSTCLYLKYPYLLFPDSLSTAPAPPHTPCKQRRCVARGAVATLCQHTPTRTRHRGALSWRVPRDGWSNDTH